MLKSVCALFSLLFIASVASAEIFKCVGKKGEALYQNFPCEFESIGGTPTDVLDPKKPPTDVGALKKSPAAPTQQRLGAVQGQKKPPALPAEPQIGMTTDEVKAIWGEPTDTVQEEPQIGARLEVWSYGDSRSVSFNPRGRVVAIQK
jgi:Domain of unknown function (DUF4124)